LVKQAGIVADKPIWVLTKDGDIEKSDNVWNPELFTGFEDVAKLLGVKLLDIDAYTKYDGDVKGWREFFGKIVLGYELHKYVQDLINKVKEALEKNDSINNNIKLVQLLYRLWQNSTSAQWGKVRVKLVTDEDSFAYSDQLLLHDIYDGKEQWSKWKAYGFTIGPFVSPKYLEKPKEKREEASSWKEFFVNVLGVKEIADIEEVEEFAKWFTKRKLEEKGYRIIGKGSGCDFNIYVSEKEMACVEVKGRKMSIDYLFIELTENETKTALEMKDNYWLAVVESIPNNPRLWILKNPARVLPEIKEIKIYGENIKKHGELWTEEQKPISSS